MNYFEKFFDCKILPLRNAPWLAKDSLDIFSWVKVRKSQRVFLFSLYFKKMKLISFPQIFPISMLKSVGTVIWSNFWRWGKLRIPSEISQPLTNMGQGIRNFKSECHFNLTWKYLTVHIENIKFETLDKQFFPHFYWMG